MSKKQIIGLVVIVLGVFVTFLNNKLGTDLEVINHQDTVKVDTVIVEKDTL